MKLWERWVLFYLGGTAYMTLEFLWRGRSHGSMDRMPIPQSARAVAGAAAVTALELLTGLGVNRDYSVWDYRQMPLQFQGQICLPYSLLWIPVSYAGMILYRHARQCVRKTAERSR